MTSTDDISIESTDSVIGTERKKTRFSLGTFCSSYTAAASMLIHGFAAQLYFNYICTTV